MNPCDSECDVQRAQVNERRRRVVSNTGGMHTSLAWPGRDIKKGSKGHKKSGSTGRKRLRAGPGEEFTR